MGVGVLEAGSSSRRVAPFGLPLLRNKEVGHAH